ncbi:MAG: class III extradiol dioxygenase subunit B-like domain-containing protein [Patescibacteria group bacterium]
MPHPLIAIPGVGGEHAAKVRQTVRAFREITREFYAAQVDIVIVITPHAASPSRAYSINQRPSLALDFSRYGNIMEPISLASDIGFGYRMKESLETELSIVLTEDEVLDYGSAVPLYYLTQRGRLPVPRVVVIGTGSLSLSDHFSFGRAIKRHINTSTGRIAVIASGDLAHGSHRRSVADYSPQAAEFNERVRAAFVTRDIQSLLTIPDETLSQVTQCGARPLALLLGIIDQRTCMPRVLSFETILGVGYLTAVMDLA